MTACRELETDFGLRNGADTERRNPKAELKKVDASLGDVRHQVGNTLKAVLESYRFQTFGEYSALLSTLNIEAKQIRGSTTAYPTPALSILPRMIPARWSVRRSRVHVSENASGMNCWKSGC